AWSRRARAGGGPEAVASPPEEARGEGAAEKGRGGLAERGVVAGAAEGAGGAREASGLATGTAEPACSRSSGLDLSTATPSSARAPAARRTTRAVTAGPCQVRRVRSAVGGGADAAGGGAPSAEPCGRGGQAPVCRPRGRRLG